MRHQQLGVALYFTHLMNHDVTSINKNEATSRRLLGLKNWSASSEQTAHYTVLDHIFGVYANNFPNTISFITCLDPYLHRRFGFVPFIAGNTLGNISWARTYILPVFPISVQYVYTYTERRYVVYIRAPPRFYLQAPGGINKNKIKTTRLKRRDLKLLLVMALLSLQGFHIFCSFIGLCT